MTCGKTVVVLLIAAIDTLWIHEVSTGFVRTYQPGAASDQSDDVRKSVELRIDDHQYSNPRASDDSQHGNEYPKKSGKVTRYGAYAELTGNVYRHRNGENNVFGAVVNRVGNVYQQNGSTNDTFAPVIIQRGNVYPKNIGNNNVFGAIVNQTGNTYPKTSRRNEVFAPIINQLRNIYPETLGDNNTFGAVVNQTGNTHQKTPGRNDGLPPVINQIGNIYPESLGDNNLFGEAVVNRPGNVFHPTQGVNNKHEATTEGIRMNRLIPRLGMMKRQHEAMKKLIDLHVRHKPSASKLCANGMTDSERLDQVKILQAEVDSEVELVTSLLHVRRNYKKVCQMLPTQCNKNDPYKVRKWVSSIKLIVWKKVQISKETWASLRKC